MSLVIKRWYGDTNPNPDGNYVEIMARQSGFWSWVLSLLKIDPTYVMAVGYETVTFSFGSISGYRKVVVPTACVASSHFGYYRPFKMAVVIFFLFLAIASVLAEANQPMWAFGLTLVGFVAAVVYFALKKELLIGFSVSNGDDYHLILKKSVIENKSISEKEMETVTSIITALIQENKTNPRSVTP